LLFNSFSFFVFFVVVLAVYYCLRDMRKQNLWLLCASLFFYGSWNWRFLFLLLFTIGVDFAVARNIQHYADLEIFPQRRRLLLTASIVANLGLLGFFKYYNFAQSTASSLAQVLHVPATLPSLNVVLVIGISFFTFQSMSYTIDVYRGHLRAAERLTDFALFVSFFPHLVAGPIMRAVDLLPQITHPRPTTWGLWKKVFVADNLAPIVNGYFARSDLNGFEVVVAAYAFAFQIYGDFSGYTDIARGVAKLLGFELTLNFNFPYFAASPQEFWTRWHISLSRWLREYLYFSLGGNRHGTFLTYRNLLLTMVIGGLWHGASWTFVLWGFYQGALLVAHRALAPLLERLGQPPDWARPALRVVAVLVMFQFTCYGWLLFRATSLYQIGSMSQALFRPWHIQLTDLVPLLTFAGPLVAIECLAIIASLARSWAWPSFRLPLEVRAAGYAVLTYLCLFIQTKPQTFIYFRF
jgi:alginate O-acetyltransferase complex protein AlgI